jgi:hypothetical protein
MRIIQEPSIGTLVPNVDESMDWDKTQNVIVEGENLEVLKLLQKAYYGKVSSSTLTRRTTPARNSSTRTTSRKA